MSWKTAQTISYGSLYAAVLVLVYALSYNPFHLYGLPLSLLLYGLHWQWQDVATGVDYPRSEQFAAIAHWRRSTTNPEL